VPVVEQLQARIADLEAMPDAAGVFAEVLRLPAINLKTVKVPSVKNLLLDLFTRRSIRRPMTMRSGRSRRRCKKLTRPMRQSSVNAGHPAGDLPQRRG
jgi:hypothetical protein